MHEQPTHNSGKWRTSWPPTAPEPPDIGDEHAVSQPLPGRCPEGQPCQLGDDCPWSTAHYRPSDDFALGLAIGRQEALAHYRDCWEHWQATVGHTYAVDVERSERLGRELEEARQADVRDAVRSLVAALGLDGDTVRRAVRLAKGRGGRVLHDALTDRSEPMAAARWAA